MTFREKVEIFEANLILDALEETNVNILRSAILLGLPRSVLMSKMEKYGLKRDEILDELSKEQGVLLRGRKSA